MKEWKEKEYPFQGLYINKNKTIGYTNICY
jgi:hypothetical protein